MNSTSRISQQRTTSGNNLRELTLQEVADCFDITRERVRQIEVKALRKMRIKLLHKGITDGLY
jgi:DNA-directed RNA polymerase sigma subunit (sigma70/sigma32)